LYLFRLRQLVVHGLDALCVAEARLGRGDVRSCGRDRRRRRGLVQEQRRGRAVQRRGREQPLVAAVGHERVGGEQAGAHGRHGARAGRSRPRRRARRLRAAVLRAQRAAQAVGRRHQERVADLATRPPHGHGLRRRGKGAARGHGDLVVLAVLEGDG